MFRQIRKSFFSKVVIFLIVFSMVSPAISAQEGVAVNNQPIESMVERDDQAYAAIGVLYESGLVNETIRRISERHTLSRYEIALATSNALVQFMSMDEYEAFDRETVGAFDFLVNNYGNAFNALGFHVDILEQITDTTQALMAEYDVAQEPEASAEESFNPNPEGFSRSRIAELQYILAQIGLYSGEIDGWYGPMTRSAIEEYQEIVEIEVDGVMTNALYHNMIENIDTPENLERLAERQLAQREESQEQQEAEIELADSSEDKSDQASKSNLLNQVEIRGGTHIEYHKVDTSGAVPEDEDDEPIYEEEDTFKQVFNLDIIGHITENVRLIANLSAENDDGLLTDGGNLDIDDVRLIGLQDDVNKFIVGSQPDVQFGNLSYKSSGETGFSWMHNRDNFSLYTLYTTRDSQLDEDGEDEPLPYRRNTFGLRVASDKLLEGINLGLNFLNTRDDSTNSDFEGLYTNQPPKELSIASITGDYEREDFKISGEVAYMRSDQNTNIGDNQTGFALLLEGAKEFSENLTAHFELRKVDEEYDAETLVDERSYYEDSQPIDDIESPYNPGETGGTVGLVYAEGNFSGDLTLEYWDSNSDDEDANHEQGLYGSLNYDRDQWGLSYIGEHWSNDGDGYEYKDHTFSGYYNHEFTREKEDEEGNTFEETFATVNLRNTININEDEADNDPKITTNTFSVAADITPIDDLFVNVDYTKTVNDNDEDRVNQDSFNLNASKRFEVSDRFTATPYYNINLEKGVADDPSTDDYTPYDVESVIQNIGVDTETVLIPEELKMLASLSYNDLDVKQGLLDENGYYVNGNEPRSGIEALAGVRWTPQSIDFLEGLEVTLQAGKKMYSYDNRSSDMDQDSWTYTVGIDYTRDISDIGQVGVFYSRSEDIDDIEEYETTREVYGAQASLNINDNTSIDASIEERRTIENLQDKDVKVVNNSIGITTRPVGEDGPALNLRYLEDKYRDQNNTEDNYSVREIRGTVGGSF